MPARFQSRRSRHHPLALLTWSPCSVPGQIANPAADGFLSSRVRRWLHRVIDDRSRIATQYVKGLTPRCSNARAAAAPGPPCGAVTCSERFTTTAQLPRGAHPTAAIDASRCARCAARRCRFASRPTICYLCGQEGDAERAHGSRPGQLAQPPRRLEVLVGGGSADHREGEGGFLSHRPQGGSLAHTVHSRLFSRACALWRALRCPLAALRRHLLDGEVRMLWSIRESMGVKPQPRYKAIRVFDTSAGRPRRGM